MSGSARLARVFGIDVRVHFTFAFVLLWVAIEFGDRHGARGALFGTLAMVLLFACITLHELGHSLVARRFGATVREIVLLPIGGLARMSREPSRPVHELLIAIAGPLVNLAIVAGLSAVLVARVGVVLPDQAFWAAEMDKLGVNALLMWLLAGNLVLALFNLLPAFPMDGGRVLRALLAIWLGRPRATVIAAGVGQVLAIAMAGLGIAAQSPLLVLAAVFVFFGAAQERLASRALEILSQLTAGEVCNPNAQTLAPGDDLGDVVDHALRSNQTLFPLVYGTELIGVVLRDDALLAAERLGLRASVRQVLRRDLPVCESATPLLTVRDQLSEGGRPVVVVDGQRLLGILGPDDLARISLLASRLVSAGIRRPEAPASEPSSAPGSAL
ncbi:MAG TPA: site-2 protease family protein [Polyangiaceae bacterium]|jgi:Zn-dependent protease|nr:site-2 protease family protein [Polyangiaceae bacterium]